jgi:serine O-acetyltransferase
MVNMEDRREPVMDLERGNLPDLVAEAVRFVLTERSKPEERLTVLESAGGVASPRDESLEKTITEATFSKGGEI